MNAEKYFITGIDTDSGKTIISAILTEKFQADYWKPIQAGAPTDSEMVKKLVSDKITIHPEGIVLQAPMSPHAAAKLEEIALNTNEFTVPKTENTLIIEGAGGVMVPINSTEFVTDLAMSFSAKVILVSRNYLGSINHTLLSIEYLTSNGYDIAGIVFNDTQNKESEDFILSHSGLRCLGRIEKLDNIDRSTIKNQTKNIQLP